MSDSVVTIASAVVLFDRAVSREELLAGLTAFPSPQQQEPATHWASGGAGVSLDLPPGFPGTILVDTVPHRWPDDMGDPQTEPEIASAWKQGQFGPAVHPGSLTRASLQSWAWPAARDVPLQHRAFIRVRVHKTPTQNPRAVPQPGESLPWEAIALATQVCTALLPLPGALGYFNPNGETVRSHELVLDALEYAESADVPPLDLWANVRLFDLDDGWKLMDTVGNAQFLMGEHAVVLPDIEACIPPNDRYDLQEVDGFLRDITLFLLTQNIPIRDGDTVPGPGGVHWTAHARQQPLTDPPRHCLRFFPEDGTTPPDSLR
ncbi:MAG: DUF4261 domain-containing protein [Bacteroidales bacterium]|nr:DUF4261 domain-containing protein [Bacteroidales bacterium]